MNYSTLGDSELSISQVGFGCMRLEADQVQTTSLLRKAYEEGVNFFDTADLYDKGMNEIMVGKALKHVRNNVHISTKVGNVWREHGDCWDWNPSREHMLLGIDESLRRLQTDYIDLYMLHGGTIEDPIDEIIETFERLIKHGKIRAYGISSIRPNVIRQYVSRSNMDCVMMQYSLADRRPEEFCLNLLSRHNISVITRGTLAKGMLVDKPAKDYPGYLTKDIQKLKSAVNETGNPVGASVQYVLQHPAVASAVIGMRTEDQLENIIQNYNRPISHKKLQELASILSPNLYEKHR